VSFDKRKAARSIYDRDTSRERISEFFNFEGANADKAQYRVTRLELLAVLTQIERAKSARTLAGFARRVWRFLKRPVGSKITDETGVESPEVNTR
jgi:hypothetical protein